MKSTYDFREGGPVSEMAIVDTFTKLIFGEEDDFSSCELMIIQAFRAVDIHVALHSYRAMGKYLRALGVREMIKLVSRVREELACGLKVLAQDPFEEVLQRRAH